MRIFSLKSFIKRSHHISHLIYKSDPVLWLFSSMARFKHCTTEDTYTKTSVL